MKRGEHKGENGYVMIVAADPLYVGAPALSALAALRSGCDLAVIAAPEKMAYAINAISPDIVTIKLKGDYLKTSHIKDILQSVHFDVLLIGPGLGRRKASLDAASTLMKWQGPKVIDATAIDVMPEGCGNCVITPHQEEYRRNFGNFDIKRVAREDFVVLRKGKIDEVSDGKRLFKNKTGNNAMTVGGTGDVLAGLVAGFIAQGYPLYEAACKAAFLNGKAGERAFKKHGYSLLASDLLDEIIVK
ncbi:NAD(P)H-hydrate dehydratase [Candidatus Micrarchaeota archaeon]|nr:MAG: NAD(P)H-hydrate dehydratase [Candidatus Micrarchaeota archaeon]